MGRMLEAEDIVSELFGAAVQPFAGKRIVVSTGATVENLDAIRTISNRSSGRMGFCLAQAAAELGGEVQIVAGQTSGESPAHLPLRRAMSSEDMRQAVLEEAAAADWFFSVAAVADFRAAAPQKKKIAREQGEWNINLVPTADILSEVARAYPRLQCLAFAAQSGGAADCCKRGDGSG